MSALGTPDQPHSADAGTSLTEAAGGQRSERSIFLDALDLASPAERAAFLDRACAGDAALRARVDALLRSHEDASHFLERDAAGPFAALAAGGAGLPVAVRAGGRVGPYRLLEKLGEGGMGVVYMAEQAHPVRRTVALKIIKPGMDSAQVVARFEAERQALALMDHPSIAKVLDAGATEAGGPYFVMELVRGVPITRYCDEHRLGVPERLELFVAVCRAVQHAHQKGVIHRDLKPSNVMVTSSDGKPVPKVIDFGIAKAIDQRLTERTLFTQYGALVGTLEYMAPEQAETSSEAGADTRSDVYSLGVLLYELLTGTTPLHAERARAAGLAELLRMVREDEPPAPSTRLRQSASGREAATEAAARRRSDPGTLAGVVRGELDWIVMRCLEKDRTRRYETADALATDVRRYLDDEPVAAGPVSRTYALRKFARRHRGLIVAASAVAAALVIGTALSTYGLIQARRERAQAVAARAAEARERRLAVEAHARAEASARSARSQAEKAEEISRFLQTMIAGASPLNSNDRDPKVRDLLEAAALRLDQGGLADHPEVEAALRLTIGETYVGLGMDAAAEPQLRRALDLQVAALGPDHVDVSNTLYQLGLAAGRDRAAALSYFRRVLAIRRAAYGEEDRRLVQPLLRLAEALARAGDHDQAAALQARATDLAKTTAGDRSVEAATTLHNRALQLSRQNDPAGAEALYRRALEIYRERLGDGHRIVATVMMNVALARVAQGDDAGAEPLLREALDRRRRAWGARHPLTGTPLRHLQALLARRGDPAADRLGLELMEVDAARLEAELKVLPDDPRLLEERAFLYGRLGRTSDEAADWEALTRLRPNDYHPLYGAAVARLKLGDTEAGRAHAREMLTRFGRSSDPGACERVAKTLLLSPPPGADGAAAAAAAMELIDRALPKVTERDFVAWWEITKALAEYRTGNFAAAAEWAGRAGTSVSKVRYGDLRHPEGARLAVLAMAHHRRGQADEAARALAECESLWAGYPKPGEGDLADGANRHYWEVLLREARALVPGGHGPATTARSKYPAHASAPVMERLRTEVARLTEQIEANPSDPGLPNERAIRHAHLGMFREALADRELTLRLDPDHYDARFSAAVECLYLGDVEGYRGHARELMRRSGDSADVGVKDRVAKTLLLNPAAGSEAQVAAAGRLIDEALALPYPADVTAFLQMTKALAEYRAGRFESCLRWVERSRSQPVVWGGDRSKPAGTCLAIAAMAHHRLGRAQDATRSLQHSIGLLDKAPKPGEADLGDGPDNRLVWEIVLREARDLLAGGAGNPNSTTRPQE